MTPGEIVRVPSPDGTWKRAECLKEVTPRPFEVQIDGEVRRRNRRDIWLTREPQDTQALEEFEPAAQPEEVPVVQQSRTLPASPPGHTMSLTEAETPLPVTKSTESCPAAEDTLLPTRKSTRRRRPPQRFKDFVMT